MTKAEAASIALNIDPSLIFTQVIGNDGRAWQADPWQRDILRRRSKRLMLNCSRRSGKSTVIGAMALDYLMRKPRSLVLIFAPTERQSKESLSLVMRIYGQSSMSEKQGTDRQSVFEVNFSNGSRICALPGKESNVRGFPGPDLVIIDEASRVDDKLYYAVRPMLSVGKGSVALLSTPFGKKGFFYKEWVDGKDWDKVHITADQCPRITREFLEEERQTLPESWFRQEYYGEFQEAEGAVFSHADIQAALSHDVEPLFELQRGISPIDPGVRPLFQ